MAYESEKVEGPYLTRDFTVSSTTAFPIGTSCEVESPRTALVSSGAGPFAGLNYIEKTATDGVTELGMTRTGVHLLWVTSGAAIVAGQQVRLSGANLYTGAVVEAEMVLGQVAGVALQDVAEATLAQIEVDIGRTG